MKEAALLAVSEQRWRHRASGEWTGETAAMLFTAADLHRKRRRQGIVGGAGSGNLWRRLTENSDLPGRRKHDFALISF